MTKKNYLLATLALLFAGAAHADLPAEVAHRDTAITPTKNISMLVAKTPEVKADPKASEQTAAQSPSADTKPIYIDGGFYGGDQ